MADEVTAHGKSSQFQAHPEGQYPARCCDVISMGPKIETFPGQEPRVVDKVVLLFRTGEKNDDGHCIDIGREFSVSMHEKASLRAFLEAWRARAYTDDQAEEGVPLHKLEGQPAYLSIVHKTSGKGRVYANIQTIMPLPKGLTAPSVTGYERPKFYAERKAEYAAELKRQRPSYTPLDEGEPADAGDDEIPF